MLEKKSKDQEIEIDKLKSNNTNTDNSKNMDYISNITDCFNKFKLK